MQKLSIVIPVYNTALYLKECLESIISQTYSEIEIICVDDCSTDKSAEIIKEYAAKDSRVKYIKHTENKFQGGGQETQAYRQQMGNMLHLLTVMTIFLI